LTSADRERLQASLRQRLLEVAHRDRVDFQAVLTRFGLERFLFRLGKSRHRTSFLLKGAFLYLAWQNDVARPTRDIDLLGDGTPDVGRLLAVIAEILGGKICDEGLDFPVDAIKGETIRESSLYDGIRIKLVARLGKTRIPLQIDIGFGDAAGSYAVEMQFPTLLEQEPPLILAYRPEFVVAEKLEAMIVLGTVNSRLKDYHDLWRMMRTMAIRDTDIVEAVRKTFQRRGTLIPDGIPLSLTDDFARDQQKQRLWAAFIARSGLDVGDAILGTVVHDLREDLVPLLIKARAGAPGVPD
jgi:hypothetical protein